MTARTTLAVIAMIAFHALPPAAFADEWRSAQPNGDVGVPAAIGPIGDIEFWAPNRGMLITQGNDGNPAGLYAYDGRGWYRYSTVCGGHNGRIAWAGPNEFWTISDQRPGQQTGSIPATALQSRSLCHFVNGRVVASYAEPLETATSYLPMSGAACSSPSNCWFAGARLPGTVNTGAFHLHWDGGTLRAVPSLTELQPELGDPARAVASLAFHGGRLYESVQVREDDNVPTESAAQPYLLHEIVAESSSPFTPLFPQRPLVYGNGISPWQLDGFQLTADDQRLWAMGGANSTALTPVTVMQLDAGGLKHLTLDDPQRAFAAGDRVTGAAAVPGADAAWVAFVHPPDLGQAGQARARLARVRADGTVEAPVELPVDADGIGRKGMAGPIACPAPDQCWMATSTGWLFHLGGALPQDTDPLLHELVTYRPPDNGVPYVPPDSIPPDNSGANPPSDQVEVQTETPPEGTARTKQPKALVANTRQRLIRKTTTLELKFTLRARARVQLVAKRKQRVVAKTKARTLKAGRHAVRLKLDRRRWPTSLDLRATALDQPGATDGEMVTTSRVSKADGSGTAEPSR